MEAAEFQRVCKSFGEFHSYCAPAFGRKQWREHSRNYLQALLVQGQERRNAGNLPEEDAQQGRPINWRARINGETSQQE